MEEKEHCIPFNTRGKQTSWRRLFPEEVIYLRRCWKQHRWFFWKAGRPEAWCHGLEASVQAAKGSTQSPGTLQTSQRRTETESIQRYIRREILLYTLNKKSKIKIRSGEESVLLNTLQQSKAVWLTIPVQKPLGCCVKHKNRIKWEKNPFDMNESWKQHKDWHWMFYPIKFTDPCEYMLSIKA